MKKTLLFLLISFGALAQTGIGTTTPNASAKLEVFATDKGFLPPRVSLTATNSASPISNPANGLMVFNTASAGASPFNVVPGYYYWDGTGAKWVSLSTTVGNVQNQAIFRSTANTNNGAVVSSWSSRFNNIAAGDLSVSSGTTFALSNGIYKIQWGLPHQQANTYNVMSLQEYTSGAWNYFNGDYNLSAIANGGNTDWGGTTFMTDILDCSSTTRTLRLINTDGYRALYYGASFIITKLNPSITTSTTADNLGNHTATTAINANGNPIQNASLIGVGTGSPTNTIHIENSNVSATDPNITTSPSLYINNTNPSSTNANSTLLIRTNGANGGNPYLSFDIMGVRGYSMGIDNADADKFKLHTNWNLNNSTTPAITITSDNRLGIGTTSPAASLHVASSVVQYINSYGYLNPTSTGGSYTANTNISYSIQADQRIRSNEFNAISDLRIKKGIARLNTNNQLAELNKLRVVDYAYIDQLANGNKHKIGFIAQEVENINPKFVNQSEGFIPSFFDLAEKVIVKNDLLEIETTKPHAFVKGDEVKFFASGKKELIKSIEEVDSPNKFTVKGWTEPIDNLFIYGKKVRDFRAIDFDQITAMSVAAIQELSKQVDQLKLENVKLNKKIQVIEANVEKRLRLLESKLK